MDKHFAVLDHQDWKPVILKGGPDDKHKPKPKKISQAQQKDIKLHKQVEKDELTHKKISQELKKKLMQARSSQKLKQKDLAQKCNLPVSVINEIESGKAIYNPQHINKIKRILKI